ncbi:MAG: 2-oxoglutarate dehydrogenase complex dihydrolipoyllysine-residue succinyltransferase [Planctomycetota bacterium]
MADVMVPEVGESITEGLLAEWTKKEGQFVNKDEPLFVLETDKITMNVDAGVSGRLKILVQAGEPVKIGQKVAEIDTSTAASAPGAPEASPDAGASAAIPTPAPGPVRDEGPDKTMPAGLLQAKAKLAMKQIKLSPAVQRIVEEKGLDPSLIPGTGKEGRIIKEDVLRYLKSRESAAPEAESAHEDRSASQVKATTATASAAVAHAPAGSGLRERRVKMSPMRQRIAERLIQAQQSAAILTTFNELDMSKVMAWRERNKQAFLDRHGVKLGFMSFFVKATVDALKTVPEVNARIDGDEIMYNQFFDIGVAIGTEQGLVVPVVRNADQLSFAQIEMAIAGYAEKARNKALALSDLMGGVFTISNGGIYGNMMSTPIINPPQSGILGMHAIKNRPVALGDEVVIRPMMYVAMSYDHRLVDGREAVTFLKRVVDCIENPERLLLEV